MTCARSFWMLRIRSGPILDPFLSALCVAELAGAVVVASFAGDLLCLHVPARPNRPQWPVIGVDHDGVPGLVRWAIVEVRRKGLWIRTRVARSYGHSRPYKVRSS